MEGSHITTRYDAGIHCDYLEDKPINAGAGIDLYDAGQWIPGRYEANFQTGEAFFIVHDYVQERRITIDRSMMRFRWPPS